MVSYKREKRTGAWGNLGRRGLCGFGVAGFFSFFFKDERKHGVLACMEKMVGVS